MYLMHTLVHSWQRLVRKRIGLDQVRVDISYVSPSGRRLRTFPEIQNHLQSSDSSHLTLDHFTFSKKVELGEVQDQKTVVCVCVYACMLWFVKG